MKTKTKTTTKTATKRRLRKRDLTAREGNREGTNERGDGAVSRIGGRRIKRRGTKNKAGSR